MDRPFVATERPRLQSTPIPATLLSLRRTRTGQPRRKTSNGGTANTRNGVNTAQGPNSAAAVNSRTGNAAVAQTNSNGVTTTQTSKGGEAKTKNGKGVAQGPGGTTCVKTANNQGCTK